MSPWDVRETFDVVVVGKRLALLLVGVTVYYLAAGFWVQRLDVRRIESASVVSLMNTVLLGLLLGFRNRAAYQRWWEARGLWGQLVNDSRNLAAKCAAYVPVEALGRSAPGAVLIGFANALRCHLRDQPLRLRDLKGFEQETAEPAHLPLYLARRLFAMIAGWKQAGAIDQSALWVLDVHARGLMDVCGGCEKIKNTPLSPSYTGLLRTGLALNILAAPWLLVPASGFRSLPEVLIACFFLVGVEVIDTIVEEPFGSERDQLDLGRYCETIRDGVEANLGAP